MLGIGQAPSTSSLAAAIRGELTITRTAHGNPWAVLWRMPIVASNNLKAPVVIAVIVVVAAIAGYFLWKGAAGTPEPTLGPGQTIQNPLGTASPGGRGG